MTFSKKLAATVAFALIASTSAALAAPAYVTTQLNVREGPGTRYARIDVLYRGDVVDVQYCDSGWCFVAKRGPNGWVSAKYLSSNRNRYDNDIDIDLNFSFGDRFPRFNDYPGTPYPTLNPDGSPIYGPGGGDCQRLPDGALVCSD